VEEKPRKEHDLVRYIYNEWKLTRAKWAFFPRSHIPLLIQIATTNLVELWHNSLKKPSQAAKKTQARAVFSLLDCVAEINETSLQWDARAEQRRKDFRSRNLSESQQYKMLKKFPFPVQRLLLQEIRVANRYIEDDVPIREFPDEKICDCKFYQKYYLPCCHIWHRHLLHSVLTRDDWENYHSMFKDNGFEVYEQYERGTNTKLVREDSDGMEKGQWHQTLHARGQFERLRSKWFSFLDETETWDNAKEKLDARSNWIDGLTKALTPFTRGTAKAFLSADYWKSEQDHAFFPEDSRVEEGLEKEVNGRPDAFKGLQVAVELATEERLDEEDDYEYSDRSMASEDEDNDGVFVDSWGSDSE